MEFTRRYLPMEWEERWKREKERRKRVMEEGGEGIEQDNRELRRIVAYNDSKMGLTSGRAMNEGLKVRMSGTGQEVTERHVSNKNFLEEVFGALREFQDSSLLTDLTLTAEDGNSIHVHALILAAVSTVILGRLTEKGGDQSDVAQKAGAHGLIVHLGTEVDHAGLRAIVEFAYSGGVSSLNTNTMAQIKAAAEVLEVPRLVDLCNTEDRIKQSKCPKQEQQIISVQEQMRITLQAVEQLWADKIGCDVILDVDGSFLHG